MADRLGHNRGSDQLAYATLPATAPAGETRFVLTTAQAKALGLVTPVGGLDGSVGFSGPTSRFDFDRSDGISPGQYDFVGVAEHEISEILGRISGLSSDDPHYATAYDLFRFSGTGTRSFSYDGIGLLLDRRRRHRPRQFRRRRAAMATAATG